jgi:2-amino-4-hydroxy-6-hydroxymethyldihydropteridine diphosphokinase
MGANLGDTRATLEHALRALVRLPGARLKAVSPFYRTTPVGGVEQPDFLNAVAAVEVPAGADPDAGAVALLVALKDIELALGRQPRERWGPREIDLDLLLFGDHQIDRREEPWLVVPHPEMANRLFVLAPLADLAPRLRPPGWDETVMTARDRRRQAEGSLAVLRVDGS